MKTAVIRVGSVLASVAALGGAFLATPALASSYYPTYSNQPSYSSQESSSYWARFSPSLILQETESFLRSSYDGYYGQNQYQQPTYQRSGYQYQQPVYQTSYAPNYGYNSYPSYQQNSYSYPSYNSGYNSYDSYDSYPYGGGYESSEYPTSEYGYSDSYPDYSYNDSSAYGYSSDYQYQYSYQY